MDGMGPAGSSITYDVLLHASVATRFQVKGRWVLAGSFLSEAAARQEFSALGREFPAETVSLRLIRCEAENAEGQFRERLLEQRAPQPAGPQRRQPRPGPAAREATRPRPAPEPRRPAAAPLAEAQPATSPWALAVALLGAALLLTLWLRL